MSEQKHTPGPWEWRINVKSKVVSLVSVSGGHWVMGFTRYGMGGAAPEFIGSDGLLSRAECFAKPVPGREHHSHWFQTLDNPNAKLIAAAPELLDALKELLDSGLALMPPAEAGKEAQDAWADRRAAARNNASALIARVS